MSDGGACVCQAVLEAGWAVGGCVQGGDGDGGVLRLLEIATNNTFQGNLRLDSCVIDEVAGLVCVVLLKRFNLHKCEV